MVDGCWSGISGNFVLAEYWADCIRKEPLAVDMINVMHTIVPRMSTVARIAVVSIFLAGLLSPLRFDAESMRFSASVTHAAQSAENSEEILVDELRDEIIEQVDDRDEALNDESSPMGDDERFSRTAVEQSATGANEQSSSSELYDLKGLVPVSPEHEAGLLGKWGDE